jgi:small-conductance mechanosensitive channel
MEELKDMAEALSEVDEDLVGEPSSHEELASEIETEQMPQLGQEEEVETTQVSATLEEEIEVADLEEIIEELVVDINPQKSGWAGTPEEIMQYKEQMRLAQLAATEAQEENQELVAARDRLSEQNDKLKETVRVLKEKFDQVSLSNAKFLYTNRVLTNNSLNERQKSKIVEALSNADSINDAKVIFETLESAVGSVTGKARPQSLRETIERPTATLPRREAKQERSPVTDRMQILAGIKKLK